jgi:4Fe-4S ferredoxin
MTDPDCKEPGRLRPLVDLAKCEGKSDCVRVCPYDVFVVDVLPVEQRAQLSTLARLKSWAHKHRKAFVVRGDDCHACGLCVTACPERAIKLGSASAGDRT